MVEEEAEPEQLVTLTWTGDRPVTDGEVHYSWEPGQTREVKPGVADRLLTNGNFTEGEQENPCSKSTKHSVYSKQGIECPECGEDKWLGDVDSTDDESYDPLTDDS